MASELQIRLKLITESKRDKNKVEGLPRIGRWTVEQLRKSIQDKGITATGATQRSIEYRLQGEKEIDIISTAGDHAPVGTLQWGRRPGKMPPIQKLKEWILAKKINVTPIPYKSEKGGKYTPAERGLNRLAFFIAKNIAKRGTDRYRNTRTDVYTPILNETIDLFRQYIATNATNNVVKALKK